MHRMKADGVTMLLVEQNMRLALEISDRYLILRDGQVVDRPGPRPISRARMTTSSVRSISDPHHPSRIPGLGPGPGPGPGLGLGPGLGPGPGRESRTRTRPPIRSRRRVVPRKPLRQGDRGRVGGGCTVRSLRYR